MLQKLLVSNYALIDKLEIDFKHGFTVITGETGAGKSILLGALGLVVGKRAEVSVLADTNKKCVVEAGFRLADDRLKPLFEMHTLDYDRECILRREISPNGKSRAFVNDTPVNLQQLKQIGAQLIDIHAQHDSLLLTDQAYQLGVLDALLKDQKLLSAYRSKFQYFLHLRKEIDQLQTNQVRYDNEVDFIRFQLDEFEKAALKPDEFQELEQKLHILSHSEEIKASLFSANQILQNSEEPVLQQINQIGQLLNRLSNFLPEANDLINRVSSIQIELKDISFELARLEDQSFFDPQELVDCQERLDLINHLMHKHHVRDYPSLLQIQASLEAELNQMDFDKEKLEDKRLEYKKLEAELFEIAEELHTNRVAAAKPFGQEVTKVLQELGMPHAAFHLQCKKTAELHPDGQTVVSFLFTASKGIEVAEMAKIASGGELSRLMLALKYKLSHTGMIPTLIFDEIDTGVSGEVAAKLAKVLNQMSQEMQLISITHLPQIAAKADHHFHVFKKEETERAQSVIKMLSTDERYMEVAKMLSSDNVTAAALKAAKELFGN
ncbi:MAG: DNA repair protein RecN [Bacteroidales bacterium]|jgi:DNA repair protein RecN (Recombination protein N)|nr:DNA repair protein RecN [Bacteroidales bacterium]